MGYVLIEYATSAPEWITSWWMIGIVIVVVALVLGHTIESARTSPPIHRQMDDFIGVVTSLAFVGIYLAAVFSMGAEWVPENEKERVAIEVSQATGQDVSSDEVADMLGGDYVPGVNYDTLSSDSGKFFKVEVG